MIYGVISYFRSLLIVGFLVVLSFGGYVYLLGADYKTKLDLLYLLLSASAVLITYYYVRYWKYILMPYSLNLHSIFSHNTLIEIRNKRTLFLDYFTGIKKIKPKSVIEEIYTKGLKRFTLEYNNLTSIDIDNYRQSAERILHYLGLIGKKFEVSIYPQKSKSVLLSFYKLPEFYEIEMGILKKDCLLLGIYEKGFYYRSLDTLDHHLIVGESGSGKSNFMHLLNLNFLFNLHRINKMYMIDLKGGVELKPYENIDKVEFVSDIERLDALLDDVLLDLKQTQELMLKTGVRKLNNFTMLIFDEIGAVSVYPDKKIRESIFNKLALIAMQGRSSGILLFLFGQKVDNTILPASVVNNVQSRVLMKTSSDYNINIIDLKDNIRERITATEIQDFIKGRAIIKDGLTSDKHLIQFPFISDKFLASIISYYSKK